MRVRIISSPYISGLNLPAEVDATGENGLYMVSSSELVRVGGDLPNDGFEYAFIADEVELVTSEVMCVRDKCCNQFGERDEIQGIIDALQAGVKARDERISKLESRPTIEDYIKNMINIQCESSLKGENGIVQMASFAVKTAEAYMLLRERDA